MLKRKFKNNLKNEEGSGLILALMVLLVLSVLGASLGVLTIGSFKLGDVNRDSNSAYYIAEAGANTAYEEFKENVEIAYEDSSSDTLFFEAINGIETSYSEGIFEPQFGDQPVAKITTEAQTTVGEEKEYIIKSRGEIAGKKRTVNKKVIVTWKSKSTVGDSIELPDKAVVISKEKLNLQGVSQISLGDVYSGKVIVGSESQGSSGSNIAIKGGGNLYSETMIVKSGSTLAIEGEGGNLYSKTLTVEPSSMLTKWVGDIFSDPPTVGHGAAIHIMNGNQKSHSSGNSEEILNNIETLFVSTEEHLKNLKNIETTNPPSDEFKLIEGENITEKNRYKAGKIDFQNKNATINIGNNNVVIFAKKLELQNSTLDIVGNGTLTIVLSEKVKFQNSTFKSNRKNIQNIQIVLTSQGDNDNHMVDIQQNSKIYAQIIAPKLKIEIQDSTFFGSIISAKVKVQDSTLKYEQFDFYDSNTGSGTESGDSNIDIEDLVASEPAFESD